MYSAFDGAMFSVNLAVTFIGLSAGLFVGTLVIRSFTKKKEVATWVLFAHFFSFVGPGVGYVVVIARDQPVTGPSALFFWSSALLATAANVGILWIDLLMQRAAAEEARVGSESVAVSEAGTSDSPPLKADAATPSLESAGPSARSLALAAFAGAAAGGLVGMIVRRR